MKKNFWQKLPHPFTVLAPMDGVTDFVFRQMIIKLGKPDVFFTEFTPVDAILSKGKKNALQNLKFLPNEQPVVAQIWGSDPKHFYEASNLIKKMNFAGIDINMGCPDKTTIKFGACAALIKNANLASEIIQATKEGAKGVPVSVKTRIGFNKEEIDDWIVFLLKQDLAALTVHLRTARELSKPAAHWDLMPEVIKLRDKIAPQTIIIGNGDISSLADVRSHFKKYKCEGFMVGRGIFHNPWLFNSKISFETISVQTKLDTYIDHIELFNRSWKDQKNQASIRKFCKTYVNNFEGASDFRVKLMETKNTVELIEKLGNMRKLVD